MHCCYSYCRYCRCDTSCYYMVVLFGMDVSHVYILGFEGRGATGSIWKTDTISVQ